MPGTCHSQTKPRCVGKPPHPQLLLTSAIARNSPVRWLAQTSELLLGLRISLGFKAQGLGRSGFRVNRAAAT